MGTYGGAVKCVDIIGNTGGESHHWIFSDAEARKLGSDGIRYPGSPSRKR